MRLSKLLFWLLTFFWFAAAIWWYCRYNKCSGSSAAMPAVSAKTILPGFTVSDSNWALSSADNLRFGKSGSTPVFSSEVTKILDSLSVYIKNRSDKTITITGHYKADEKNNSSFQNLGLARADELKKWLAGKGLPDTLIITQSRLDDGLIFSPADTLVGGISLVFNNIPLPALPQAQEPVKDDLFEPRTVYFNTGKNKLTVNTELKDYLEKIKNYLQNHADKKLSITGYTDNAGDAEKNMQLSVNRAAFVKGELIKRGIEGSRIESSGKGMNEPVADNNTDEGKAKNRRVTIQLQ